MIYIEKSKLNIADMWLIPLDRVTFYFAGKSNTVHLCLMFLYQNNRITYI